MAKALTETKRIGRQFSARLIAACPLPAPTVAAAPVLRPLSGLDGPLSHLLAKRNEAELELGRARLNVERFIAACQVIMQEAGGVLVSYDTLPAGVRDWVKEIRRRAEEKATVRVQRAD
jgi:hypothetical protein